jgi:hypothetical protein
MTWWLKQSSPTAGTSALPSVANLHPTHAVVQECPGRHHALGQPRVQIDGAATHVQDGAAARATPEIAQLSLPRLARLVASTAGPRKWRCFGRAFLKMLGALLSALCYVVRRRQATYSSCKLRNGLERSTGEKAMEEAVLKQIGEVAMN